MIRSRLKSEPEKVRSWHKRSKRVRRMSAKQQTFNAQFERAKVVVLARSGGSCEAQTPACRGYGQHVHHRSGRVGPGVNHPDMLLHCCEACHSHIHAFPGESRERGWLVSRLAVAS